MIIGNEYQGYQEYYCSTASATEVLKWWQERSLWGKKQAPGNFSLEGDGLFGGVGNSAVLTISEAIGQKEVARLVQISDMLATASTHVEKIMGETVSQKISRELFGPGIERKECSSFCPYFMIRC